MNKTADQIRTEGLAALRAKLGRSGMIRFLQQFDSGSGNYAESRHKWVDATSLSAIRALTKKPKRRAR